MVSLIWTLGSTLILVLLISFLPIGFTFKGKFITVLASFVLALGGVAAVESFPLWQSALMMGVLTFFVAYFMDNRIGTLLYKENNETPDLEYHIEMVRSFDMVQLNEELSISGSSLINIEKVLEFEVRQPKELLDNEKEVVENLEILNGDILNLMERNTKDEVEAQIKKINPDSCYLSEIESLLAVEAEKKADDVDDLLEKIRDYSPIVAVETLAAQIDDEKDPLDDSLFDFLLVTKEVATGRVNIIEEIETKKN